MTKAPAADPSNFAERLAALSSEQRALLERLASEDAGAETEDQLSDEGTRVTLAEEMFWMHQQRDPHSPAETLCSSARINGPVDQAVLERAVRWLEQRHDILRTSFHDTSDALEASVQDSPEGLLSFLDISDQTEDRQRALIAERIADEAQSVFDLARAPLLRFVLIRKAPDRHQLIIARHHVATDGCAIEMLMAELSQAYQVFQETGAEPALPSLKPMRLIAQQERYLLNAPEGRAASDWWRARAVGRSRAASFAIGSFASEEPGFAG